MEFDDQVPDLRSAHVVVVGNEKGGAGKSTVSIHLAVALLKAGYKVACIDLDTRQQTMTRFFENRRSWSANSRWPIELPRHCAMGRGESSNVRANETHEFAMFAEAIGAVEHDYEFVVIDTPAADSYLMRLAHSLADTLVSPLNDSYVDIDVLSRVRHDRAQRGAVAHYAALVMEARRKRRLVDNGVIDWVMVRNRIASLANNNARKIAVS
ncbi:MAG: division plane positioning ATPase MipZ, partial [Roseiarcus sp.]